MLLHPVTMTIYYLPHPPSECFCMHHVNYTYSLHSVF